MTINDIARVKIDWMEKWVNEPHVTFILKRDRRIFPFAQLRWRQFDNLFVAEHENEVHYIVHNRNDHNGYGGSVYKLHMVDEWQPSDWRDCSRREPRWGSGGGSMEVHCTFDESTRILRIKGPWSGNPAVVFRKTGIDVVDIATLEGPSRLTISNPRYYASMQRRGQAWDGTAIGTSYRLEFVRQVIDTLAPHVELWQGDYGWTVKLRDMPPKNPRRSKELIGHATMSAEQSSVIYSHSGGDY